MVKALVTALVATLVTALFATALPSQEPSRTEETVNRMIERLGDPRADLADATMLGLMRGGTASAPLLRAMMAKAISPGVRARVERALAICAVEAPIVNGLKVGLRADRPTIAFGDSVELTATLCNVSDAPINIYLGMSFSGNVLENGLALRALGSSVEDSFEQGRFGPVGFCGTGAYRIVVKLAPWTSQEFSMNAKLSSGVKKDEFILCSEPHLNMGLAYLPLPPKSKSLRLQVNHKIGRKQAGGIAEQKVERDWQGTLVSNELRLDLRSPAKTER